ncbi:MAG: xanthine dehydrogenase molybdopterin binding subunit [Thalassospira sp.]|uniref:xanthine dehydrogenase molybdopterin binding subunit n=1 Tax=Thalassospira sp. TaxID=1912094 RepID=UPI001AFDA35A|nr:xanthine dehydrogenase molybdopterin binding subunit [Thalassospira sp.]MBO6579338.1 xanthine dehydrogenase molybdopterin binding subunit [Thalassospira sp.]MBO6802587.1 xanthine dehydrogenase molybdopterin binding subunit [Thalassospira sp.]MBO6817569.1 xanthine dehydrogenase molybdopterin binding subunit [Thalassospira sp.]MBO6887221.1 xanthine dehydrogenase molybdopterin binding subunit [Thalassospira sp.]
MSDQALKADMDEVVAPTAGLSGGVRSSSKHDSGPKHVAGEAVYIDDINEPFGTLHLAPGASSIAHGKITKMDLSKVRSAPGVVCVLTADDIPGVNDVSPAHTHDEPVLPDGIVQFYGQPVFCVAAETRAQARAAAQLAEIEYEELPAVLDVAEALEKQLFVAPPHVMKQGDAKSALARAKHRHGGRIEIGGQDHFYLEGHISFAIPGEDGDVLLHCSTQHPSEVQHNIANVLGRPANAVTVEVRRMGGGFGGKETQAMQWAALAAIVATKTGRPAKFRLDRDDDMVMTGKRHDFIVDYDVGFDDDGRICGLDLQYAANCGFSADLSAAIADRAMFHTDNAYYLGDVEIRSYRCKTNLVSNTAFRGFGGPQGMVAIERIIDEIAMTVGRDPLDVRIANYYDTKDRNTTPYHMVVEDNVLSELTDDILKASDYRKRREEITAFNAESPVLKKGLSLTPVKFGISFTTTFLNQAGALIHVYQDGSVHLNHGGTEMGQGLFIKVAQVVAEEFQIDLDQIKITPTNTGKVPNTSATAASSGADMNGMAARDAAMTIKNRLIAFAAEKYGVAESTVRFVPGKIIVGDKEELAFADLIKQAYLARVSLSATGYYATPKIHYDRESASGRPFYYFAYGMACSEVLIDTLTGEYKVTRVDIIHDVGRSLNPAIDLGQIEGGFIQGMGWLTSEELWWDDKGSLRTHAPSTYKIPACSDRPEDFRMELWSSGRNVEKTIHRSKAVGEPPLMLAISVHRAIADAVASVANHKVVPALDTPATPEAVLHAVADCAKRMIENAHSADAAHSMAGE